MMCRAELLAASGCGEDSDAGSGVVWSASGLIVSTPRGRMVLGPRWPRSSGLTARHSARPSPAAKIMTSTMAAMWRRSEDRTVGRAGLAVPRERWRYSSASSPILSLTRVPLRRGCWIAQQRLKRVDIRGCDSVDVG